MGVAQAEGLTAFGFREEDSKESQPARTTETIASTYLLTGENAQWS
ncbi:hypothetical protein JQ607_06670 [Bradyrhizobium liaoningense]|nr:hypothetical protein [Bradyrhizobium liaoningense]MBR0839874.1 hypothetical protein [Bradyrhizobium liaoningense]